MNTIYQDQRTTNALKVWAGTAKLLTPTFFFWNAGTDLQRGSVGLLRSLLHQLISALPVMETDFLPTMDSIPQHATQQLPIWTEQRLCKWLLQLIEIQLSAFRLCIFIDGLDEFIGDQNALISLIMKLIQLPNTKICLSSRPLLKYDDHFGSSAMLKLQDLTRSDIKHYVCERFAGAALGYSQAAETTDWFHNAVHRIIEQAEGVFLWVTLAVNDQLEGIYNGDSPQLLQERLESFPAELEGVYTLMVNRIDRIYREECALYLRMVIDFESIRLSTLALAVYEEIDQLLRVFPNTPAVDLKKLCQSTSRRIAATCKGFLEMRRPGEDRFDEKDLDDDSLIHLRVVFVHRTAADFLQQNIVGKELLGLQSPSIVNTRELYTKANLAMLILYHMRRVLGPVRFRLIAAEVMKDLSRCQEATGKTYSALAEVVDKIMSSPNKWNEPLPAGQHRFQTPSSSHARIGGTIFGQNYEEIFGSYPKDFLGYAAGHGLGLYVLQKLDASAAMQNQQYKDYLLACIIITLEFEVYEIYHLKLISALLRRGASPNLKVGDTTSWAGFLGQMLKRYGRAYKRIKHSDYCDVLVAFLESGADIHAWIPGIFHKHSRIPREDMQGKLQIQLSPWYLVRHCFGSQGDIAPVERAFTARQGSDHSVCIAMTIATQSDTSHEELNKRTYSLSATQSDRLICRWLQFISARAEEDAMKELLCDEIEEIYHEICDEEDNEPRQQQQELREEDDRYEPDSAEPELSDEGSFHSANS